MWSFLCRDGHESWQILNKHRWFHFRQKCGDKSISGKDVVRSPFQAKMWWEVHFRQRCGEKMDFSPHICLKWTSHHIFAWNGLLTTSLPEMDFSPHICLKWTSHHIFAWNGLLTTSLLEMDFTPHISLKCSISSKDVVRSPFQAKMWWEVHFRQRCGEKSISGKDVVRSPFQAPHLCLKWTSHHIFAFDVTLLQEIHSQNTNKTLVYIYQ
jgi:hypothetical protein